MKLMSERLKHFRKISNLSIREVAKKLEISPSTYRSWEQGVSISGEPYVKLAAIYQVSLHELLTGERTDISKQLMVIEEAVKQIRVNI